jgi:hypothetical protein
MVSETSDPTSPSPFGSADKPIPHQQAKRAAGAKVRTIVDGVRILNEVVINFLALPYRGFERGLVVSGTGLQPRWQ